MRPRKLIWHIFPINLLVTLGALLAVICYGMAALQQIHIRTVTSDLADRANLIEDRVSGLLATNSYAELNLLCRRIGHKSYTRISVIKSSGEVVADSDEEPLKMGNQRNHQEVEHTLMTGEKGSAIRYSSITGTDILYVAMPFTYQPLKQQGEKTYVLRMAMPFFGIDSMLRGIGFKVFGGVIIAALLAAFINIVGARRISKPLEKMEKRADEFANENFAAPLVLSGYTPLEVEALASAMNRMAKQLQKRINVIIRQRNELKTVLASMVEAVLVVDPAKKVLSINNAAAELFATSEERARGRYVQGLVRNLNFAHLLDRTLTSRKAVYEIITFNKDGRECFLQGSGVCLYDGPTRIGAVMVFNDITHIKRLENMRRDFVANVSHELMTPLTSIKGYSETIMDIVDDDPGQSKKFLQIIINQADQLRAIVDDLLDLSRLEQETEQTELPLVPGLIADILLTSEQVCSPKAAEKEITIVRNCPDKLMAKIDTALLEQAVVNLLTNAIKYSEKGSRVEIEGELRQSKGGKEMVAIAVKDYGPGIESKHLPRLFERFYRSDKARSRKLGGTGLGLAIVKHIVQAHNGTVSVQSSLGKGSTFTILLPGWRSNSEA